METTNVQMEASTESVTNWRDFSDDSLTPPLRAARDLFARHGYDATSIREVANRAGLSVPGLYYHYESKQAILQTLIIGQMDQLLAHTQAADRESDGTAISRFDNVIECLLRAHLCLRDMAFIASSEMRSLTGDAREHYIVQRDEQQAQITEIVEQGIAEGRFHCNHVKETSRAIASLCISVASWYRSDGPLTANEIMSRYLAIARRIVGIDDAEQKTTSFTNTTKPETDACLD